MMCIPFSRLRPPSGCVARGQWLRLRHSTRELRYNTDSLTKKAFKKMAVAAAAQMEEAGLKLEAASRSSIAAFLELDNVSTGRRLCSYLDSSNWRGAELMFQCRAGCLRLNGIVGKWSRSPPRTLDDGSQAVGGESLECGCCNGKVVESMEHFFLECPCYESAGVLGRQDFFSKLKSVAGDQLFSVWLGLSQSERVRSLLGDKFWKQATNVPVSSDGAELPVSPVVHGLVQDFLASAWKVREDSLTTVDPDTSSARGDTERVANGHMATAHN